MQKRVAGRKVREAIHAGSFYPEDPTILASRLAALFSRCPRRRPKGAIAIASPHAGLDYSGDLAALAWLASEGRDIRRIVILAPLHHSRESAIYLPESATFEGPLGPMEVDRAAVLALLGFGTSFVLDDKAQFLEHGIEVQLPFARYLHPLARIVPVLLGRTSPSLVRTLATGLRIVFERQLATTLFVVSTDLAFAWLPSGGIDRSDRFLDLVREGAWKTLLAEDLALDICGSGCMAALLESGFVSGATLLGRHDRGGAYEEADEDRGEYAALAFY